MGLLDALHAARTGLGAASAGLRTTSQNVTNASTLGYTRQRVEQSAQAPIREVGVWLGSGVRVDRITRMADTLVFGRVVAAAGDAKAAETQFAALSGLEGMFEPTAGVGLRGAVDGIFAAFGRASSDPSDSGGRREVVAALATFTRTVSGIAQSLTAGIAERDASITAHLDAANGDLAEVATLNAAILAGGDGRSVGDLADRRDLAIHRLADSLGATFHVDPDGTTSVLVGGHAAVSGINARTLSASGGNILLSVDAGNVDVTADLRGAVGGERDARAVLVSWLADTDALVTGLAGALNAQNAAGFTATGAPGGQLFTLPGSGSVAAGLKVNPAVVADPGLLAFAGAALALPGDGNNLLLLRAVEDTVLVGGETASNFASSVVGRVASDTSLAELDAESTGAIAADVEALHANLTSVDLDEEAVQLIQYQTAYQAAAKVIQAADEMLRSLLQIVN